MLNINNVVMTIMHIATKLYWKCCTVHVLGNVIYYDIIQLIRGDISCIVNQMHCHAGVDPGYIDRASKQGCLKEL